VTAIKLTTKSGMVGQAAEAVANVQSNPDLYLKVVTNSGEVELPVKKTPRSATAWNGSSPRPCLSRWYSASMCSIITGSASDAQVDHITLSGWGTDGQRFHVDLLGQRIEPPRWALPAAATGGVMTLLVLLRFVWDQVI